ncbi:MAG TPA: hydroxymethylbilane synthase [Candidatus Rubrimentiphilum sp.]|nr:hydroxymethylbilane synthase [Candidatus Rubrimentiphilum sp.]
MSFPITLYVRGRLAVVAGGGEVARKKSAALHAAGARLRVVAPDIADDLRKSAAQHGFELHERAYAVGDLEGAFLAIAATGDDAVNAGICADAHRLGVLVCDASKPERGDFAMSATVQIGDLTFAVDTGGAAPAFAKRLTGELREHFGESYAAAIKTLGRMREYVKSEVPKDERAGVLRALAELPVEQLAAMSVDAVVCATRGSTLAMIQARTVAAKLAQRGVATTFLNVTTTGDRIRDRSFADIGAENLFVKELEIALRERRARYAVHSAKDLPSSIPDDMQLAAISSREDPRDVFCSERFETFDALPAGARVGTSSLRRRAQLAALRSDLQYVDLRGNVDTRLRKLREGEYEAIVLAAAGLQRLHATAKHMRPFTIAQMVPAAGQGALAVELRTDDELAREVRAAVNDPQAELAIVCERAALRALRGGCQAPIGLHARFEDGQLEATGAVAALDGSRIIRTQLRRPVETVPQAETLGADVAAALEAQGASEVLGAQRAEQPLRGRLVVLPRTQEQASRIAAALRADGAEVVEMRSGEAEPSGLGEREPDMIVFASSGSVSAASAYLARVHRFERRPAIAAMGPASSAAAHAAGFTPDLVAPEAEIDALVGAIRSHLNSKEHSIS